MLYFLIIISDGREIPVSAQNKSEATKTAISENKMDFYDLFDVIDILELTSQEFNNKIGIKIRKENLESRQIDK